MKFFSELFYEPKHENRDHVTDAALTRSIIISVVGIFFCLICLFGLTWAWYTSSITSKPNTFVAAGFDVEVTVEKSSDKIAVSPNEKGKYTLNPGTVYDVSIVNSGTATTGFCCVSVGVPDTNGKTIYYTNPINKPEAKGKSASAYKFAVSGVESIEITPMWGKCPETNESKFVAHGGALSYLTISKKPLPTKAPDDDEAEQTTVAEIVTEPPTNEVKTTERPSEHSLQPTTDEPPEEETASATESAE